MEAVSAPQTRTRVHAPFDGATRADAWKAVEERHWRTCRSSETWRVKPAVNQGEQHPWLARADTVKCCEDQGILMEAYSKLARAQKMHDRKLKHVAGPGLDRVEFGEGFRDAAEVGDGLDHQYFVT